MRNPVGRSTLRPVTGAEAPHVGPVNIRCPYPLMAAGLARALEEARLPVRRSIAQAGVPHLVVLWAEDAESLKEDIRRVHGENPDSVVVVLGLREELPLAWAALQAGARGFVHAGMPPDQIVRAISVAAKGEVVAPRSLIGYLASDTVQEKSAIRDVGLRPRQQEILELVAEGLSNAEIARRLYLSESTVKQHLRAAYKVLGVSNRTEAARLVRDTRRS